MLNLSLILTIDYTTANGPKVVPALTETQKAALYAELASGAESGWDYTMRWFRAGNLSSGLLALNVRNTIAVDLNSLLCTCIEIDLWFFWTDSGLQIRTNSFLLVYMVILTLRRLIDFVLLQRHSRLGFLIFYGTLKRSDMPLYIILYIPSLTFGMLARILWFRPWYQQ